MYIEDFEKIDFSFFVFAFKNTKIANSHNLF